MPYPGLAWLRVVANISLQGSVPSVTAQMRIVKLSNLWSSEHKVSPCARGTPSLDPTCWNIKGMQIHEMNGRFPVGYLSMSIGVRVQDLSLWFCSKPKNLSLWLGWGKISPFYVRDVVRPAIAGWGLSLAISETCIHRFLLSLHLSVDLTLWHHIIVKTCVQ